MSFGPQYIRLAEPEEDEHAAPRRVSVFFGSSVLG